MSVVPSHGELISLRVTVRDEPNLGWKHISKISVGIL
jgi:hypothetical protein